MSTVVSSLFRAIKFPFQGKIVTVDQLAFFNSDSMVDNVPFIGKTPTNYENVGVGIFKDSLLGHFLITPPNDMSTMARINMISTVAPQNQSSPDSWVISEPSDYQRYGNAIPLNEIEMVYHFIQSISETIDEE